MKKRACIIVLLAGCSAAVGTDDQTQTGSGIHGLECTGEACGCFLGDPPLADPLGGPLHVTVSGAYNLNPFPSGNWAAIVASGGVLPGWSGGFLVWDTSRTGVPVNVAVGLIDDDLLMPELYACSNLAVYGSVWGQPIDPFIKHWINPSGHLNDRGGCVAQLTPARPGYGVPYDPHQMWGHPGPLPDQPGQIRFIASRRAIDDFSRIEEDMLENFGPVEDVTPEGREPGTWLYGRHPFAPTRRLVIQHAGDLYPPPPNAGYGDPVDTDPWCERRTVGDSTTDCLFDDIFYNFWVPRRYQIVENVPETITPDAVRNNLTLDLATRSELTQLQFLEGAIRFGLGLIPGGTTAGNIALACAGLAAWDDHDFMIEAVLDGARLMGPVAGMFRFVRTRDRLQAAVQLTAVSTVGGAFVWEGHHFTSQVDQGNCAGSLGSAGRLLGMGWDVVTGIVRLGRIVPAMCRAPRAVSPHAPHRPGHYEDLYITRGRGRDVAELDNVDVNCPDGAGGTVLRLTENKTGNIARLSPAEQAEWAAAARAQVQNAAWMAHEISLDPDTFGFRPRLRGQAVPNPCDFQAGRVEIRLHVTDIAAGSAEAAVVQQAMEGLSLPWGYEFLGIQFGP